MDQSHRNNNNNRRNNNFRNNRYNNNDDDEELYEEEGKFQEFIKNNQFIAQKELNQNKKEDDTENDININKETNELQLNESNNISKPLTSYNKAYQLNDKNRKDIRQNTYSYAKEQFQRYGQQLYDYYCSLCGANVLILDCILERLPKRRTDNSSIINGKMVFIKNYMRKDKLVVLKKDNNKYEKQWRYNCNDCGAFIGYQAFDFFEVKDEFKSTNTNNKEKKDKKGVIGNTQLNNFNNNSAVYCNNKEKLRDIIYINGDTVMNDPISSEFYLEMEKIKLLKASKINYIKQKKRELDETGKDLEKNVYL